MVMTDFSSLLSVDSANYMHNPIQLFFFYRIWYMQVHIGTTCTLDQEIFAGEIFAGQDFRLWNFASLNFFHYNHLTKNSTGRIFTYYTKISTQLTLTLIIWRRKYLTCLILVLKVLVKTFFSAKLSRPMVYMYMYNDIQKVREQENQLRLAHSGTIKNAYTGPDDETNYIIFMTRPRMYIVYTIEENINDTIVLVARSKQAIHYPTVHVVWSMLLQYSTDFSPKEMVHKISELVILTKYIIRIRVTQKGTQFSC